MSVNNVNSGDPDPSRLDLFNDLRLLDSVLDDRDRIDARLIQIARSANDLPPDLQDQVETLATSLDQLPGCELPDDLTDDVTELDEEIEVL